MTLAMVSFGISQAAAAIHHSEIATDTLKSYELDPRSIELAKQGDPSWGTFRKRVWQNEAIFNSKAYTKKQLSNMTLGKATIVDGKSMHLHHVFGKSNDMYTVIKVTQPQHTLIHQTIGYHYNSLWNWQSILQILG